MSRAVHSHEPSMDEILASIRRIIADDASGLVGRGSQKSAPVEPQHVAPEPPESPDDAFGSDELDLASVESELFAASEEAARDAEHARQRSSSPSEVDLLFEAEQRSAAEAASGDGRLLSPNVDAVVSGAFADFANLVMPRRQRTVEDLLTDMLRPMLKTWLDQNLPMMVERIVREEIERVSQRGRR